MARLPSPGGDQGVWGDVLNDFLTTVHNTDGTLKDDSVSAAALAPGAVSAGNVQDGTITEAKLDSALQTKVNAAGGTPTLGGDLSGTTSNAQIVAGAVGATELANGAIATDKIQDGAVTGVKLANGTLSAAKLGAVSAPTSGQILSYNGSSLEWVTGTSPTTLDDLSDVNTAGAADGQSLVYQSGTWTPATVTGGGGVTDHGALTGLSDDDHPQYHNNARGDARYYTQAQLDSALGTKVAISAVGVANGVASLDATGKVPTAQLPAAGTTPDATTSTKGIVQLAGDLGGTAALPTVPGLANKANSAITITGTGSVTGGGALTANRTLGLVNDSTSPGASRYYGTDGSGTKGYFTLPTGSGAVDSVNGQTGVVVLTAANVSAMAVSERATWPIAPAGTTATVDYNTGSSSYPSRPTNRTDIIVRWRGPVAPNIGGAGAVDNVDEWVNTP